LEEHSSQVADESNIEDFNANSDNGQSEVPTDIEVTDNEREDGVDNGVSLLLIISAFDFTLTIYCLTQMEVVATPQVPSKRKGTSIAATLTKIQEKQVLFASPCVRKMSTKSPLLKPRSPFPRNRCSSLARSKVTTSAPGQINWLPWQSFRTDGLAPLTNLFLSIRRFSIWKSFTRQLLLILSLKRLCNGFSKMRIFENFLLPTSAVSSLACILLTNIF
jgi:hypothetical protein